MTSRFCFLGSGLIERFAKALDKDEKVAKINLIAAVEIKGGIDRAKDADKGEEVGKVDSA